MTEKHMGHPTKRGILSGCTLPWSQEGNYTGHGPVHTESYTSYLMLTTEYRMSKHLVAGLWCISIDWNFAPLIYDSRTCTINSNATIYQQKGTSTELTVVDHNDDVDNHSNVNNQSNINDQSNVNNTNDQGNCNMRSNDQTNGSNCQNETVPVPNSTNTHSQPRNQEPRYPQRNRRPPDRLFAYIEHWRKFGTHFSLEGGLCDKSDCLYICAHRLTVYTSCSKHYICTMSTCSLSVCIHIILAPPICV